MKKIIIVIGLVLICVFFGYNYIYQEHRNIYSEDVQSSILANTILKEFKANSSIAEEVYLNKTIEIKGMVTEVANKDITVDNAVFCNFSKNSETKRIRAKRMITIKGRCIGYDDLLELVKLDQCTIKN